MTDRAAARAWSWGLSALSVAVVLILANWLGWWGIVLYVPVGFFIGGVDGAIERRLLRG